jgi:hypothetical protein
MLRTDTMRAAAHSSRCAKDMELENPSESRKLYFRALQKNVHRKFQELKKWKNIHKIGNGRIGPRHRMRNE